MNTIIKYLRIGLLIIAVQFFLSSSCNKNKTTPCYSGNAYAFQMRTELLNEKEVYNVNDTIILISNISKILLDYTTPYPKQVDYSNCTGITGNFKAATLDSINHEAPGAIDSFTLIPVIGSITSGISTASDGRSLYFTETTSDYQLKILIILLKKGSYQIGTTDFGSTGIKGKDCTNAGFSNQIINANKHLNILSNAQIPGVTLDQYLIDHIYCFRVQ